MNDKKYKIAFAIFLFCLPTILFANKYIEFNSYNKQIELSILHNDIQYIIVIKKVSIKKFNSEPKDEKNNTLSSFVYGTVQIKNLSENTREYNISNILLSIGSKRSKFIAIDSIAHVLIDKKDINKNSSHDYKVYWVFEGSITKDEIDNIKIILK